MEPLSFSFRLRSLFDGFESFANFCVELQPQGLPTRLTKGYLQKATNIVTAHRSSLGPSELAFLPASWCLSLYCMGSSGSG